MDTPETKRVYENHCRVCSLRKVTSKLSVIITKRGEKTEIGKKLERYCGVFVTNDTSSRHICVVCKTKVEKMVEKVEEIRTQWERKGEAGKQELTVGQKRVLSLDDTRGAIKTRLVSVKISFVHL